MATLALAGLRVGECLALLWEDVDTAHGLLHVRRSKTDAGVAVDMTPWLRRELVQHKLASKFSAPKDFVFCTATGKIRDRKNVLARVVRPSAQRANETLGGEGESLIPADVCTHDLRRLFSSLLSEVSAPTAYRDQQVGHKGRGLADAYDRPFKRDRDIGERIDALILSSMSSAGEPATSGTTAGVTNAWSALTQDLRASR